jgi:hypothetical protein
MNRAIRLALVVGLLGALWGAWSWWSSEERRIRSRLDELADLMTPDPGEPDMARLARFARFRSALTVDIMVDVGEPIPPITSRETLIGLVFRAHATGMRRKVELSDVQVSVVDSAHARVLLTAVVTTGDGSAQTVDARELEMGLVKNDGAWLVAHVVAREPLRPVR